MTITTGIVSYKLFSNIMITQIAKSRVDVLEKISQNMGTIKKSMVTISDLYYYNDPMNDTLVDSNPDNENVNFLIQGFNKLNGQYSKVLNHEELNMEYVVAMENGFSYESNKGVSKGLINSYKQKLWYRDIINNKKSITWVSTYDNVITEDEDYVFSAARNIMNNDENVGIFLVNISENHISKAYENLVNKNSIYIIDSTGKIVSHHNKYLLGFNFYNMKVFNEMFDDKDFNIIEKSGEKYLFSKYYNKDFDWIVIEEIPLKYILTPLIKLRNILICVIGMILVLCLVFSIIISRRTSKPLNIICKELEKVGQGEENIKFDVNGWYEINKISQECRAMVYRIDNLLENVRSTEQKKRKAELNFLQMQINPHFMYNTLFSTKCLVVMGQNEKAEKMLNSFIVFLKGILSSTNEMITIDEELYILNEYVYIQKYRFGNKFDIIYNCDENLKSYKIPRLLLQPIVENAIIHGIEPKESRGKIEVNISRDRDKVCISISDDGVGMELDNYNEIKNKDFKSTSIGLSNVSDRIKLNYGENYTLKVESQLNVGTKVRMWLPLMNEEIK